MELLFLGTGAGELWPSPFCPCDACQNAIQNRGRERRIGACLMVDRHLLFDAPPNCGLAALEQGVSLADVKHLFVTHSHQDHFDPCVLAARGRQRERPLDLCCNRHLATLLPVYGQFNRFFNVEALGLRVHPLEPGMEWRPPDRSFTVTALLADHDRSGGEIPLIFILKTREHCLLYACDTGWIPEESWECVAQNRYGVGCCLDTSHANLTGDPADAVDALGKRLLTLHVSDNNGKRDEHALPFDGAIDWSTFMAALDRLQYASVFMMEVRGTTDYRNTVKQIAARFDRLMACRPRQ